MSTVTYADRHSDSDHSRREVGKIAVFRGCPVATREWDRAIEAALQFQRWRDEDPQVQILAQPLNYRTFADPETGVDRAFPVEKGVDVELASMLVAWALTREFEAFVVASDDADIDPALRVVRSYCPDVELETVTWRKQSSARKLICAHTRLVPASLPAMQERPRR